MCMMVLGPGGADPAPVAGDLNIGDVPDPETVEGTRAVAASPAAPSVTRGSGGVGGDHEGRDSPGPVESTGAIATPEAGKGECKHCHNTFAIRSLSKHQKGCGRTMLSKTRWEVTRCCFPGCSGEGNACTSDRYSML